MYFSKFPKMQYTMDNGKTFQIATDILVRAGFIDSVIGNQVFYEEIDVPEGDTPEILADKVYGNSLYHWVILLANNIVDPVLDWPMTQNQLANYVEQKYSNGLYGTHHYEDVDGIIVNQGAETYPVSNYEYESRINDTKRRIKIPRKEAIQQIVQEFEKTIK